MKKSSIAAALLLAMSATAMSAAKAGTITYYFSLANYYNGSVKVTDPDVFAEATISDFGAPGSNMVSLTMTALQGLDTHAYVSDWAFNLADGSSVTGTQNKGGSLTKKPVDTNGVNGFGSDNGFDLGFSFDSSNPGQLQYPTSSYSTYLLTGTNLSAASFEVADTAGHYNAVHVQGLPNNSSSFYYGTTGANDPLPPAGNPVPEPATVAILGFGMLGLAFARRRKSK